MSFLFLLTFLKWIDLARLIDNTKWDTREIGVEYSPYVDFLLKEFQQMGRRLNKEMKSSNSIPSKLKTLVWESCITFAMEQLVDGYARAKRCSSEGRAMMSLDLKV